MFNVALFGTDPTSITCREIIEKFYNKVIPNTKGNRFRVVAYIANGHQDSVLDDVAVVNIPQVCAFYEAGLIHAVIIPRELFAGQNNLVKLMVQNGINIHDIYISGRIQNKTLVDQDMPTFLTSYLETKYLPYLEYHIADHCNLNCKACEHYSGLVTKPKYPVLEDFKKDITRLSQFIEDIGVIRILGGEPLLNPQIVDYMRLTRRLYQDAYIYVVTNALKLLNMPEDFFKTLKEERIYLSISMYPPIEPNIHVIRRFLEEKGVGYTCSEPIRKFEMKQTLKKEPDPEYFYQCFQALCHNLYEGHLAACFLPFTTKYFNDYFGQDLPEDGAINLYDDALTTSDLKSRLLQPFERCRYCKKPVLVDWEQISHPSSLSDWVID